MPQKTLIISGIYPPESGGPGKFAKEFSGWLSSLDNDTKVLCYSDLENIEEPGFEVDMVSRKNSFIFRIFKFIHLIYRNSKANIDVIAVGAFIEVYLATIFNGTRYIAKVPGDIVWERARNTGYTNLGIEDFQNANLSIKYKLFRYIFSLSLKRARSVIVPSIGLKNLCIKWGVDPLKLKVIYNSVDTNFFVPGSVEIQSFDITTACRLTAWKKVDELIILAAKMGLRLGIAGDGPEKANLQLLAQELDANVVFFGDLTREELLRLFHDSRFFVLNSEYEGLPHVLVEARSSGVLSLARSGTGSSEVIHDKYDGYVYSNLDGLFQTINYLAINPKSVQPMKDLARQDALLRFNRDYNFVQILEVIRES